MTCEPVYLRYRDKSLREGITQKSDKKNKKTISNRYQDKDNPQFDYRQYAPSRYLPLSILPPESLCIFGVDPSANRESITYLRSRPISRYPGVYPVAQRARALEIGAERATDRESAFGILWEPLKVNSPRISFRVVPTDIPSRAARNCAAVRNRIGVSLAKRVYRGERDSRGARIRSTNRNSSGDTKVGHRPSFRSMRAATATEGKEKYARNAKERERESGLLAFFSFLLSQVAKALNGCRGLRAKSVGRKND